MVIKQQNSLRIFILCAMAVCLNVILGSIVTFTHIPFLFLDALGTIFISVNFKMRYGILTGLCTNLLLGVIHGPLALPFGLVSVVIAITANLCAKNGFTYYQAIITGVLLVLIGSLASAPIRLLLYGGFGGLQKSVTDLLVFSLRASGKKMITAAYWGAVTDGIFDKIISCLLISWINSRSQTQRLLASFYYEGDCNEWPKENS
ncbi:hypothetical protein [Candidatus Enterococcus moelleringii]|uniref:hypothetical protein n=1 Tax=Candidatus Enterococcus moelleringii TaxID=2815325 RepID=UPI001F603E15|nr:hypothetical protein [Enterococcus sp. 669A]